jgi:hypothetical protein
MRVRSKPPYGPSPEAYAHYQRCQRLPPLKAEEIEGLVAAYLVSKSITTCPTRFAAPIEQRPRLSRGNA